MIRIILSASIFLLMSSVAHGTLDDVPVATIAVHKVGSDEGGLGSKRSRFFESNTENVCKGWKRITKFSWITGDRKTINVPANIPLYITAYTKIFSYAGVTYDGVKINTDRCSNTVQFTPKPGVIYDVRQSMIDDESCSIRVTIADDGGPPADLREVPYIKC